MNFAEIYAYCVLTKSIAPSSEAADKKLFPKIVSSLLDAANSYIRILRPIGVTCGKPQVTPLGCRVFVSNAFCYACT